MELRGWGNALAVAGLLLAVGIAAAQAPAANPRYWVFLAVAVSLAVIAIVLLRPRGDDQDVQVLLQLRRQTTDRDIAFLRAGTRVISFPETLSEQSIAFTPFGETWSQESKEAAHGRAKKLIGLGLMEPRGSEVETSPLGIALVGLDQALKEKRSVVTRNG